MDADAAIHYGAPAEGAAAENRRDRVGRSSLLMAGALDSQRVRIGSWTPGRASIKVEPYPRREFMAAWLAHWNFP